MILQYGLNNLLTQITTGVTRHREYVSIMLPTLTDLDSDINHLSTRYQDLKNNIFGPTLDVLTSKD